MNRFFKPAVVFFCLVVFAQLAIPFGFLSGPEPASAQTPETILEAFVDNDGVRWKATEYTASFTGSHDFTLEWDDATANIAMAVYELPARSWRMSTKIGDPSPQSRSVNLVEGTTYQISVWSKANSANATVTLTNGQTPPPPPPPGDTTTETIFTGIRDASKAAGPRWVGTDWTSPLDGEVTLELTWVDPTATIRFAVYDDATGAWINSSKSSDSSGVTRVVQVTEGQVLRLSTWAQSGSSTHELTATYESDDTTPPPPPPADGEPTREVFEGQVGTSSVYIPFTASSTGRMFTSLNYSGGGPVYLYLRNASGNRLVSIEKQWNAKGIEYEVSEGQEYSLELRSVSGQADYHLELYIEPSEARVAAPVGRPNIIVVNTDDQRADSLRHLPQISSWFTDGGVTFENGYVNIPTCCPSRASLFSGQYSHNNGVIGQSVPELDQNLTVQRELQDAGYYTAFAGKYVHFWPQQMRAPHWDNWTYFKGGYENIWINFDGQNQFSTQNSTITTFDQGISYIDGFEAEEADRPWFLHLTPVTPHSPATPEDQYENAPVLPKIMTPNVDEADRSDKPAWVRWQDYSSSDLNNLREDMVRTLYTLDDQMDRLMNHLDSIGELDNTMVIFTSDNGYMHGEHGRRGKFLPYDPSIRVPFLIYWDGVVTPGTVDDRWVGNIDIAPTVLAAAGVDSDLEFDGQDIFTGFDRDWVFTEYFQDPDNNNGVRTWVSARNDQGVYIEYYEDTTRSGTPVFREYYDLVNDPYQLDNLFGDDTTANDPDITQHKAQLDEFKDCSGSSCHQ